MSVLMQEFLLGEQGCRSRRIHLSAAAYLLGLIVVFGGCTSAGSDPAVTNPTEGSSDGLEDSSLQSEASPDALVDEPPRRTIYSADFETPVDDVWSTDSVFTTADGDATFLGRFANEGTVLELKDLPAHEVVTIAFDLYVVGAWGLPSADRWRMFVDQNRVIDTTFSNVIENTQSFPANTPLEVNPGRWGAVRTGTLSESGLEEAGVLDSVYRIERTFLHTDDQLRVAFGGRNLTEIERQSWGIDNVEISLIERPAGQAQTSVTLEVTDGRIVVSGQVPTQVTKEYLHTALELSFGGDVDAVDLDTSPAPAPLWLYSIAELADHMRAYADHTLAIDEENASVTGSVRTERWQRDYGRRLLSIVGPHVEASVSLDVALSSEVVTEVEEMRVFFASSRAELTLDHEPTLDRLIVLLEANPRLVVRVDGHTDTIGERAENRDLSSERAQAVLNGLLDRGANPDQLESLAAGEVDPETDEADSADRATNRRVSFTIPQG